MPAVARRLTSAAALVGVATVLSGCLAIKSETTSQRAPGVVSLNLTVCATDDNRQIERSGQDPIPYTTCDPNGADGTAQNTDEGSNGDDAEDAQFTGQILVGFRVPDGSTGPDSFPSSAADLVFTRSQTYTDGLTSGFPPAAGTHWAGYISTPRFFDLVNDPSSRSVTAAVEFTLPAQAGGAPLAGPYRWRPVVGLRNLENGPSEAGDPVTCAGGDHATFCVDSPLTAVVPTDLEAPVSDFGVLNAANVQAGHGETATVTFPVQYLDAGRLGAQDFALSATTNLPGATATPSVTALHADPDTSTPVQVSVPVPAGTPLGSYTVTLSAATGSPAVTRSSTATIEVVDRLAPSIRLRSPADGATFTRGQAVTADYDCAEEFNGSGLQACAGPVASGAAIDTATTGTKTFTVTAVDNAGNRATASRSYTVVTPPAVLTSATLERTFVSFPLFTTIRKMNVLGAKPGMTIRVSCKGKGCPKALKKKAKTLKVKKAGKVALTKLFKGAKLRVGTTVEVRILEPGAIGRVERFKIRRRNVPKRTQLCIDVGKSKPGDCPST